LLQQHEFAVERFGVGGPTSISDALCWKLGGLSAGIARLELPEVFAKNFAEKLRRRIACDRKIDSHLRW